MFRSFSRCRTGMLIAVGALLATGLTARESRGLRTPDSTVQGVISTPALPIAVGEPAGISVDLQIELLHARIKNVSDYRAELIEPFTAFAEALRGGALDESAIFASVATIADPVIQDKYDGIMRDFGRRILAGQLGFDLQEFDMVDRPMAWRVGVPDLAVTARPKALCNTCTTPSVLPNPTTACQYISGNTTTACPSDFYSLTLTAGVAYQFTMCAATCPSATGNYDTRIRIRQSGSCTILVDNDDFCGLLSQAQYTPATTGTYIIEVTGFTTGSVGNYTMGYRQMPASTCGTCATPAATITPTTVCQTVSNNNTSCPDPSCTSTTTSGGVWYNVNLTAGRNYTFSTCPNNAAGGACFGTASYDTRLDLWNSTCTTRLAGNDDIACTLIFRSAFLYSPPTTGVYKLQVRGFCGDTGTYTLAYQEQAGCVAPSIISNTPTTGTTNTTNCQRSQTFSVGLNALATGPFTGTFSITPSGGSSASPTSGSMTFSGTTGSFTSNLTRPACGSSSFTVTATVNNACGSATRTWTYTLTDGTAPNFATCPGTLTLDCAAPDPPPATMSATDNCDPAPTITFAQTRVNGNCPGNFTTRRTWTARDCSNNSRVCTQNINHRDTTPPVVSGAEEFCLWPPNHEYYCFQSSSLNPSMSDNCSPPISLLIVGCTSNEPDEGTGDGDFPNDCVVSPDGKEVCVRSERAGSGSARVYRVMGIGVDACGNRSAPTPVAIITIPHDDSEHPECREPNSGLDKHF